MRMTAAIMIVAALGVCGLSAGAAGAATTSNWYWTPGACKSMLQQHGVAIGDGRTFNVVQSYCIGLHNHCWLQPGSGLRRYKVFNTVMRSYDGVVRYMVLEVTGKNSWTGSGLKIMEPYMTLADFNRAYGGAAWTLAARENMGGCYDVHP